MKYTPIINEIVNEVQTKQQDECIRDAAPELLDAIDDIIADYCDGKVTQESINKALRAAKKAKGMR